MIGKRAAIDKNTPQLINFTILANLGICNKYTKCYPNSIVDLRNWNKSDFNEFANFFYFFPPSSAFFPFFYVFRLLKLHEVHTTRLLLEVSSTPNACCFAIVHVKKLPTAFLPLLCVIASICFAWSIFDDKYSLAIFCFPILFLYKMDQKTTFQTKACSIPFWINTADF